MDDYDSDSKWYGVRLIFRVLTVADYAYEERVTIWRADSIDEAIQLAEAEGVEYCSGDEPLFEYVGLAQAFHTTISDRPLAPGDEVFSLIRDSKLEPDDYVDRFFTTGEEYGTNWADPANG